MKPVEYKDLMKTYIEDYINSQATILNRNLYKVTNKNAYFGDGSVYYVYLKAKPSSNNLVDNRRNTWFSSFMYSFSLVEDEMILVISSYYGDELVHLPRCISVNEGFYELKQHIFATLDSLSNTEIMISILNLFESLPMIYNGEPKFEKGAIYLPEDYFDNDIETILVDFENNFELLYVDKHHNYRGRKLKRVYEGSYTFGQYTIGQTENDLDIGVKAFLTSLNYIVFYDNDKELKLYYNDNLNGARHTSALKDYLKKNLIKYSIDLNKCFYEESHDFFSSFAYGTIDGVQMSKDLASKFYSLLVKSKDLFSNENSLVKERWDD